MHNFQLKTIYVYDNKIVNYFQSTDIIKPGDIIKPKVSNVESSHKL